MSRWDDIAAALRGSARRAAVEASPPIQRFKVVEVDPLRLEAVDGDEILEEGDPDFEVSQVLRLAHGDERVIALGDEVYVHQDAHGDWIASGWVTTDEADPISVPTQRVEELEAIVADLQQRVTALESGGGA